MKENKGVRTQHPEYTKALETWNRCRDAIEGEKAVHAAGVKYLPKLLSEDDKQYKARMGRTPFFNTVWRTISGLKGMAFRKKPLLELPAAISAYSDDIDLAGTPLDVFAQNAFEDLLSVGRCGLLIDYAQVDDGSGITVAEATARGLRPSLQYYPAESVYNWKTAVIDGVKVNTLICLKEKQAEPEDEFDHSAKDVYRVLDITTIGYRQRLFEVDDKDNDVQIGDDIYPLMNGLPMQRIPFVFLGVDDLCADVDEPPLLDLIDMNLHHYRVSADYEHGCHLSGLPTLFITGYVPEEGKEIYIGGAKAQCLPDSEAEAKYVEVEGNFKALRENLDSKKLEMAVLGSRMLESQKATVEAADTIKQRSAGEQSQLAAMCNIFSMGMARALGIMAQWGGASGTISYQLSTDFMVAGLTAQELTALVSAWQSGGLSYQELFMNLKNGELISAETTIEEEQARIESQGFSNADNAD